jgi:hypothetical protein
MSGLASLLLGAAGSYAGAKNTQQNEDYKDAKLKAIMSGGAMPEKPKSLGSQLVGKIKDAMPTFGYDSNAASSDGLPADKTSTSNSVTGNGVADSEANYRGHFDGDTVSDQPTTYKNIYA